MKVSKKINEILSQPVDSPINTGISQDVAETARTETDVYKQPRDEGFIDQFIIAYGIAAEDVGELNEFIEYEVARRMREHFNRVLEFFEKCNVPKVYILAVMIRGKDENIVEIASRLGISKQAVHKHLRRLEPHFSKLGKFNFRRRNFKEKEPNVTNPQ